MLSGTEVEECLAAQSPASELEALIERLERVTSRLERLPALRARSPTPPRSPAPSPASAPSPQPQELEETDSMSLNGYQDIVQVGSFLVNLHIFLSSFDNYPTFSRSEELKAHQPDIGFCLFLLYSTDL